MKIIGFLQVKDELSTGHLERFVKFNMELLDELYVYDDGSSDGTIDYISKFAKKIVKGRGFSFGAELTNKQLLLAEIQADFAEGDAILWLDADEVIYASKSELVDLIVAAFTAGYDSVSLPFINLWRSEHWLRTDDNFDALRNARVWKLSQGLFFPTSFGLHHEMIPRGLKRTYSAEYPAVVHYGFSTERHIVHKYLTYRNFWQDGRALDRLIDENGRTLEPLMLRRSILGARYPTQIPETETVYPEPISPQNWQLMARQANQEPVTRPIVTIVSLIFSSTEWLEFQYGQMLRLARELPIGQVRLLFVANDASEEVLDFLSANDIPHISVATKRHEHEWFINSVYRAYNEGVARADSEYVLLVNSDMAYAPGALSQMLRSSAPDRFLACRLVEAGVMPSGKYGVERDFGNTVNKFRYRDFNRFAETIRSDELRTGGLFMPLLVHRRTFLKLGGFPEGNVKKENLSEYISSGKAVIAEKGEDLIPGDQAFISRAKEFGVEHFTDFASIAYHFQAGEMRTRSKKTPRAGIAIVNNALIGINGEKVLWGEVASLLEARGIRVFKIELGYPSNKFSAATQPLKLWLKARRALQKSNRARIVFTNATYQIPLRGTWRTIVLRQDEPAQPYLRWMQERSMKAADLVIVNDANFLSRIKVNRKRWMLVPLARDWSEVGDSGKTKEENRESRRIRALFVGALNATKGWPEIKTAILRNPEIEWTVVSKRGEDALDFEATNVSLQRKLSAKQIKRLMAKSDFLIVNSPYETQCLVALEAISQNIPVLTSPTGVLGNFGLGRWPFGLVGENVDSLLAEFNRSPEDTFYPRRFAEELGVLGDDAWAEWTDTLRAELQLSFLQQAMPSGVGVALDRIRGWFVTRWRFAVRSILLPLLIRLRQMWKA